MNLTLYEIRRPRTVNEFLTWCDSVLAEFSVRSEIGIGVGPVKVFREEVLPFRRFVKAGLHDFDGTVEFPADDGKGDAKLCSADGTVQWIEITEAAKDPESSDVQGGTGSSVASRLPGGVSTGYRNRLQRERLHQSEDVHAFGRIWRNRCTKKIEAIPEMALYPDVEAHQIELVEEAIRRKSAKNYPPGSWLLVAVDDEVLNPKSLQPLSEAARNAASNSDFQRIYLVGRDLAGQRPWCIQVKTDA